MSFKCLECGHIFDEGEEMRVRDEDCEWITVCPICEGNYEGAQRCRVCGGEFLSGEMVDGVCEDCIDDYRKDFDTCYSIADRAYKEEIKINALLVSLLDVTDIETILYQHLKSGDCEIDCSSFIDNDRIWFAGELAREVNER